MNLFHSIGLFVHIPKAWLECDQKWAPSPAFWPPLAPWKAGLCIELWQRVCLPQNRTCLKPWWRQSRWSYYAIMRIPQYLGKLAPGCINPRMGVVGPRNLS